MPLSTEAIQNKPLSGTETRKRIVMDVDEMLQRDGMFSEYVAYGRLAYKVTIEMQMDNMAYPKHEAIVRAKRSGAIEGTPPLNEPSRDKVDLTLERERTIDSPNALRIESNLPITVQTVQQGQLVTREIQYEKEHVPPSGKVTDSSKGGARKE